MPVEFYHDQAGLVAVSRDDINNSTSLEEAADRAAWNQYQRNLQEGYILAEDAHLYVPENNNDLYNADLAGKAWKWGTVGKLDFWSAHARGMVERAELRAVELLFTVCDEYRASKYLHTGLMEAMGNFSGRTFIVRRDYQGVKEMIDGKIKYSWCIRSDDHLPPTDRVIALKSMIEGEELAFRRIGNRSLAPTGGGSCIYTNVDAGGYVTWPRRVNPER